MEITEKHMGIAAMFEEGSRRTHERLTWYTLNNQLVLSQLQNDTGTTEAATTLDEAMNESLSDKVKLTLEAEMGQWNVSTNPKQKKLPSKSISLSSKGEEAPYHLHCLL
eukprot:7265303-Ditylum_brightwellii.AAC.1